MGLVFSQGYYTCRETKYEGEQVGEQDTQGNHGVKTSDRMPQRLQG